MASFPPRKSVMLETIESIHLQVDHLFLCLNQYEAIPDELGAYENITAIIPDEDIKDLGKFYFTPDPDDVVFTIDDDILYPSDYVTASLAHTKEIGLEDNIFGYMANALVPKKQKTIQGWRNYMFFRSCEKKFLVDILGTGTALMTGENMPSLEDVSGSAGFVDLSFALWQKKQGNLMWTLPRDTDYLKRNLPDELQETSLFKTKARSGDPELTALLQKIAVQSDDLTGKPWQNIKKRLQKKPHHKGGV